MMSDSEALVGNRYRLAGGSPGCVQEAADVQSGRRVALKETLVSTPDRSWAFRTKARKLCDVVHPALARVYDYFVDNREQYLVMEFVEGRSLAALMRERSGTPLPVECVLAWGDRILGALEYLHERELAHGAVHPANVLLTPREEVVLVGYSLDTSAVSQVKRTPVARVFDYTPGFVAREEAGGGPSPKGDVYGLGAMLYYLATGTPPPDAQARRAAVAAGAPDPLRLASEVSPHVSHEVARPLRAATSLDVRLRPDARNLRKALRGTLPGASSWCHVPLEEQVPTPHARVGAATLARRTMLAGAVIASCSVGFASLTAARGVSNEAAAVGNLRAIGGAEETYQAERGRFASFDELVASEMLDDLWTQHAVRDGYIFSLDVSSDGRRYQAWADPENEAHAHEHFYVDERSVIRHEATGAARSSSAPIGVD